MTFESTAALANHQKKFCVNGEYGTLAKLEDKLKASVSPATDGKPGRQQAATNSLTEKHFRENVDGDRNKEMVFELEKYKEERKRVKLDAMNKEEKYMQK